MSPKVRDPLFAAIACAAAFIGLLALAYGGGDPAHADAVALHGFTTLDTPSVDRIVVPVALSVGLVPMLIALAVMSALGIAAKRPRHVAVAIGVVAAAAVSSQILKAGLAHSRFDPVLGSDQMNAAAFPSGHATSVMALAVAALLISPRRLRPLVAAVAAACVLAVTASTLILGWHFPSDVLGGMLLALGFGCLGIAALRATEPGRESAEQDPAAYGDQNGAYSRPRIGAALDEWAAGALAATLAGALVVGIAISRAGEVIEYAHAQTVSTGMAMVGVVLCASLLAGFAALARD